MGSDLNNAQQEDEGIQRQQVTRVHSNRMLHCVRTGLVHLAVSVQQSELQSWHSAEVLIEGHQMAAAFDSRRGYPDIVDWNRGTGETQSAENPAIVTTRDCGYVNHANEGLIQKLAKRLPILLRAFAELETRLQLTQHDRWHDDHGCARQEIQDTCMAGAKTRVGAGIENESFPKIAHFQYRSSTTR